MGFLHKDTAPDADLSTSGIRCRAVVEQSQDDFGAFALRGSFGGGMITEKGREQMLSGEKTMSRKKVTLRIQPPDKDAYTIDTKIDYPMMKANWLYRGSSFEILVDPNKPDRFAVDWEGPHEYGTAADLAGSNPLIAASMKGAGLDVNQLTQMQLAARQMQAQQGRPGGPTVFMGGQMYGPAPITPGMPGMPAAAPAATAAPSNVDQLAKLAELHNSGALTDEEFAAEKAKLLNS